MSKGKRIEEVKKFTYLGYVFKRNEGQHVHMRARMREAGIVMNGVWGIGKRKFGKD